MVDHVQLELFDLHSYTSKQFSANEYQVEWVEKIQPLLQCKQLELELFPQQANEALLEFLVIAA